MSDIQFTLFETAIGACAIAWRADVVIGAQLPEGALARTRAGMKRRFPGVQEGEPPHSIREVIAGVASLLAGERRDLREIELDMRALPEFHRRVYAATRAIPPGQTRTYGQIAAALGEPGAARAVGQALGRNPFPPIVPCHRVLAAGGKTGGFSAPGGVGTKLKMLAIEGFESPGKQGDLFRAAADEQR